MQQIPSFRQPEGSWPHRVLYTLDNESVIKITNKDKDQVGTSGNDSDLHLRRAGSKLAGTPCSLRLGVILLRLCMEILR
jgi:hypothetical protein